MAKPTTKNFANGHFELQVYNSGAPITSLVKGVEGGLLKAASVEEPMAGYHLRGRHAATREIEPLQIEFAMSGARWALQQIEGVINRREHSKVSGTIVHSDMNFVEQYSYGFTDARLIECTFPKCDAKSKDYLTLKAKFQPETIDFKLAEGPKVRPGPLEKQKMWLCSAFRLNLEGYQSATDWCTSVEPLTFKVNAKAFQTGFFKLPEIVATKVEMPKLSFQIPAAYASPLLKWYEEAIHKHLGREDGMKKGGGGFETVGSLEFLDPTHSKTVYEIEFDGVGIEAASILKSEANQAGTKMIKFDCYITSAKLNSTGQQGFI
jgi:hypothetical protein